MGSKLSICAVKHGLQAVDGQWKILITAQVMENEIAIVIKDNGVGIDKDKLSDIKRSLLENDNVSSGVGINNVNSRIKLAYGQKFGVDIFSDCGTQVLIHLPYVKEVEDV